MNKHFLIFIALPFLSGCMGTFLKEGDGKYIDAEFPDIRCVPSRQVATAPRILCNSNKSSQDMTALEEERKKIKARDNALRKRAFPS